MTAKINLAPEVYQKAQRAREIRRITTSLCVVVCAVSIGGVVLGLITLGAQTATIAQQQSNIDKNQTAIKSMAELPEAVTAAEHLSSLDTLRSQRVYISRFFTILQTFAPDSIKVGNVQVSSDNMLTISAQAQSYELATKFARALELANTEVGPGAAATNKPYFNSVQLSAVTRATDNQVSFQLTTSLAQEVTQDAK